MSCARPRCPQAQPHRLSSFHHLPCCLSSSFSEQYGSRETAGSSPGGLAASITAAITPPSGVFSLSLHLTKNTCCTKPLARQAQGRPKGQKLESGSTEPFH